MKRRLKAKAAAPSALDVTRCLRRVLRDPRGLIKMVLCRELNVTSPDALKKILSENLQVRLAVRAAIKVLFALRRLVLILGWPCFQVENSHLSGTTATNRYARRAHTSGSNLYKWRAVFSRSGIIGLAPDWRGGRPGRATTADRVLLRDLPRMATRGGLYSLYRMIRLRLKLPGRPFSPEKAQRCLGEIADTISRKKTKGRKRSNSIIACTHRARAENGSSHA